MIRLLHRLVLRMAIADIDNAMVEEQKRVDEWPQRRMVWLRERSRFQSKIDRLRGARELVNHQFRRKA